MEQSKVLKDKSPRLNPVFNTIALSLFFSCSMPDKHCWFDLNTNGNLIDASHYNVLKFSAWTEKPGKVYLKSSHSGSFWNIQ